MTELRENFPSSDGKNKIVYRIWEPEDRSSIRAVLQISHGMAEHIGRYKGFAEFLTSKGFAVSGNDHLGHGETAKNPEDLGFIAESTGYRYLVEDVHQLTVILHERYPDKPVILMGHSMGSFIARLYLSHFAEDISAAIIMGTAGPGSPVDLGILIVNLISLFYGERHRSKLVTAMAFGSYNKKIAKPCRPAAWLTKNETILDERDKDPFCTFIFTLSAYRDMFCMLGDVNSPDWASSVTTSLPILLISGGQDPVGNYGKGVQKVASMLGGAGVRNLTVKLFPDDRHEILYDADKDDVYAFIEGWLNKVLDGMKQEEEEESGD